ncbi:hypothetical protein E4U42_003905 [Claviceps africana]|uniref:Zn(2)-C6 fungal-type domain-containing protein n=1 Tax=Claviceps africana TaxID=83212 RepID=A0A8K0J6M5_9HYPO|nr:hypothetical protein E4U42_003905 [Claviceps africana]
MELTRSFIQKRPQPYAGFDSSPLSDSSPLNLSEGGFEQLSFEYQPSVVDQHFLSYGQTSSFEDCYSSQPEQTPAKRRKLENSCGVMPQRYSTAALLSNSEKGAHFISYDNSSNGQQFLLPRWAEPVIPHTQTLAQFPRRVAEMMCGGCGLDTDQADSYRSLPEGPIQAYETNQPYSAEKQLIMDPSVIQQTIPAYDLIDTGPAMYEGPSTQITPSLSTFTHTAHLQPQANFLEGSFICDQDTGFSAFFPDPSMKEEFGPVNSAFFAHEGLALSDQTHLDYNIGNFGDMSATVAPVNHRIGVNSVPGSRILMTAGSLIEAVPQQSWTNASTHFQQSNFDILLPNQRGGKRGPFRDPTLREQTAQTRKIGSCIRCRMQRIRCEHNPNEPGGACLTCQKVSNTKAGRFPCLRYKITDIRLFKPGQVPGYEWTRRWTNNISDPIQKWASPEVKFIRISTGYSKKCIELQVREFVPQEGDKLERTWVYQGTKKSVAVPPYALMDLEDGKTAYMKHISEAMGDTLQHVAERSSGLLKKTYIQAFRMYRDTTIPEEWKQLFDWTFRLWTAVRLSTTSDFIVGEEKLGMSDNILDNTNPNHGKIPVPPVLGAQLDLVMIHHIQTRLRRELLDKLQKMVLKNKQSTWFVTYLVTFMLLHNAALLTAHDAAYARKHGIRRRFAREDKVREYHLGANILLAHFHYCNKGWYPFSDECKDQDLRTLADLSDDKVKFVHETRKFAKEHEREWERLRERGAWEDDYYFVSQLFQENWHPRSDI